ncbi:hypothetical protein CHCC16874_1842 [Bacillus licheniformis]|nr:hypothetical protein CHCC16874_1842 [Bacillus licheniformis]
MFIPRENVSDREVHKMFTFLHGNAKNHWSSFYIKRKNKKRREL